MKKKNNTQALINSQKNITIFFGYSLFALTLVALTVSTIIPWTSLLLNPTVRHLNVAMTLISFVAAAILPPLMSYILGDRSTHSKNKASHHFNGVLFGLATYWLSLLSSLAGSVTMVAIRDRISEPWATIINGWPIIAIILIMASVAITYAHRQKVQGSVLQHTPYQLVLIGALSSTYVYILATQDYTQSAIWLPSTLYIGVTLLMIAMSYKSLGRVHSSRFSRLTSAVIAASIGLVASSVAGQLTSYLTSNIFVPLLIGAIVWVFYLWLILRKA